MIERRDERLGDVLARQIPAEPTDPAFTAELWDRIGRTGEVRRGRAAPLWRRRPVLAAAVAAVVAAAVLAVSLFGGTSVHRPVVEPLFKLGGPSDASAAHVVAEARLALGKIRTLRARWTYQSASVGFPPAAGLKGMGATEIYDRAEVGPLTPSFGPSDGVLTSDGRARWDTDVSRSLSGRLRDGKWVFTWTHGTASHGVPPTWVQISDAAAATSLNYAPEMWYVNESIGQQDWQSEEATTATGYAAGPPDASLDALVPMGPSPNAFSALDNGTVWESTYLGRPCLTVVAPVSPGPIQVVYDAEHPEQSAIAQDGPGVDKVEMTFDRASHLPVRVATYLRGHPVALETLVDVRINEPVAPSEFEYAFRKGARIDRRDFGFRATDLGNVESAMGYAPLVPARVPAGFKLEAVRCARRTVTDIWQAYPEGSHKVVTRRVTSIGYGKGFLHLSVSLRPARGLDPLWLAEPFREDPSLAGATAPPERVTILSGALTGARAFVSLPPFGVPHLWAIHDGMVVTVAGDVTREQLLRVAGSLAPLPDTR
jgi:hypothetical protein